MIKNGFLKLPIFAGLVLSSVAIGAHGEMPLQCEATALIHCELTRECLKTEMIAEVNAVHLMIDLSKKRLKIEASGETVPQVEVAGVHQDAGRLFLYGHSQREDANPAGDIWSMVVDKQTGGFTIASPRPQSSVTLFGQCTGGPLRVE